MKTLFYYLFGWISALYAFTILFNLYGQEFIDDYWLDYMAVNYPKVWYYGSLTVATILIIFVLIFVFNLGKGTNHERRESSLIKKEEENE